MAQAKLKGTLALTEIAKIDNFLSSLNRVKYFTICDIRSGYHHKKQQQVAFGVLSAPSVFLNLMFKLFFIYLDDFLVFLDGHLVNIKLN